MKWTVIISIVTLAGLAMLTSCKDDEVPIAGIEFELEEQEVPESDGTIESFHPDEDDDGVGRIVLVKLIFDRALAGDVVIEFDVDGTARRTKSSSEVNDFEIEDESDGMTVDGDNITLLKGSTEASFSIRIFEDYNFEFSDDLPVNDDDIPYESIELSLESVVSGPGKLGTKLDHELKILEDDGYVYLEWNPADQAGTTGDVDMDLFVYINGNLAGISSLDNSQFPFEALVIPGGFPSAEYGMGYVYKSGTSEDLAILSEIANFGGTITTTEDESGAVVTTTGKYTLANINAYDSQNPSSEIEQSFEKDGLDYLELTNISVPESGSRMRPTPVSKDCLLPRGKLSKESVTVLRRR